MHLSNSAHPEMALSSLSEKLGPLRVVSFSGLINQDSIRAKQLDQITKERLIHCLRITYLYAFEEEWGNEVE